MNRINLFLCALSLLLLTGCEKSYEDSKHERMLRAAAPENQQKPVVIGIPWRKAKEDFFIAGVKLAVKEINQKGGVLNHVPLKIIIDDTENSFFSIRSARHGILSIARAFAANPDVIAVVGHNSSETAMIASVVYENNGIVFLAPNARFTRLTGHNFNYTFRTSLNNAFMGQQLANFAVQKGYKHIAILAARKDSTDEFVNEFVSHVSEKYPTDVVYRRSFFEDNADIVSLVADLKSVQNQVDLVLIATESKKAAQIYQQMRHVGITLPIIGNATLDTKEFWDRVKQWEYSKRVQKSHIPTLFTTQTSKGKQFDQQFQQEYHQEPDYLAALGYDSIKLLAHAIEYSKSKVPVEIASTLRYMNACKGVAGSYEFERNGDLKNKPLSFYHIVNNDFVFEYLDNGMLLDDPKMEVCNEIDRDHDGIPTSSDVCPDTTPAEMVKGINQDGAERGCPLDSDKDGVADYKDKCVNDSTAAISQGVNALGCPLDFDGDGIPDYKDPDIDNDKVANKDDHCPKTGANELTYGVNMNGAQTGCPVDHDADKVLDYQDKCLNSLTDFAVDNQGCELINSTEFLKPVAEMFDKEPTQLTKQAKTMLDTLLSKVHSNRLKQIQMTIYGIKANTPVFSTQLNTLIEFIQQKQIPAQKIHTAVVDTTAQKNQMLEIIISEFELKTVTNHVSAPQTTDQKTPSTPDQDSTTDKSDILFESELMPFEMETLSP